MANEAIGMIETKGLVALVQATDAMLKAASVKFVGWNKIGSGLCSVFVQGTWVRCVPRWMREQAQPARQAKCRACT